ncbi:MAG: MATE family efflux transporter [Chloroflexi bacterium]|nr:MAG: MATE family efflux transporter [Chloroflexota bacterium]
MISFFERVVDHYRDPEYFQQLFKIGIPIALQQAIFALLNMVGYVMVGQRGDVAMAAVGVAGQVYFLLNLFLFGVVSGSAMVTAQLWGKRDILNIRKVLALCLWMSIAISGIFMILAELIPAQIVGFYSSDPQVIALGSDYLRILAGAFIFFAITFSYGLVLRSVGNVLLPVGISIASLVLNILLSWLLIFGKFGLPELGVLGAAWAAFISRVLECVALLVVVYGTRSPVAASLRELFSFDGRFFVRVMKPVLPVIINELAWSLGITFYNKAYGHIGTVALAAINIMATVDNLALALFMGISNATSVAVGNSIGAGEQEKAYRYAGRSLGLGTVLAVLVGAVVLLTRNPVISMYKVSPEAADAAFRLLTILGLFLWIRGTNMTIIVGLLRGGGDTLFSLGLDGLIIWILGVPMAFLGAYALHLPIHWVYLMVMSEEVAKWILGLWRYFTRKWIHDLTHLSTAATLE